MYPRLMATSNQRRQVVGFQLGHQVGTMFLDRFTLIVSKLAIDILV